jgi:hypothetical protein
MGRGHRTRTDRICGLASLACAVAVLQAPFAIAGSASSQFTISITVTPTRSQSLRDAQISVREGNETTLVLTRQQQAAYIRDPASIRNLVRAGSKEPMLVTVYY